MGGETPREEDVGLPPKAGEPVLGESLTSETGIPVPTNEGTARKDLFEGSQTSAVESTGKEVAQAPEAEEEKFDYNAEVAKVEARYKERLDKWEEVMKEAFKDEENYKKWLDYGKNAKEGQIQKDSPAERLFPMAQALKRKQFEILDEKVAAMLALDKKVAAIRMRKIEQI